MLRSEHTTFQQELNGSWRIFATPSPIAAVQSIFSWWTKASMRFIDLIYYPFKMCVQSFWSLLHFLFSWWRPQCWLKAMIFYLFSLWSVYSSDVHDFDVNNSLYWYLFTFFSAVFPIRITFNSLNILVIISLLD